MHQTTTVSSTPLETLFQQAIRLYQDGKTAEAIAAYNKVLAAKPDYYPAWLNLGTALRKSGQFEASVAATMRALELRPDDAGGYTNLGNCLIDLDRLDDAMAAHDKALALQPNNFLVLRNRAIALRECGRFAEAIEAFDAAALHNDKGENLEWERAMALLHMGDFERGWKAFEARWQLPGMRERQSSRAKRWQGEDIAGKTLLIYEEQGFGDSILCSRYIPLIAAMGVKVRLEVKKPLHELFSTLPGVISIGERGSVMDNYDYHVPMMSLPGIFKTDLTNIPPPPQFKTDAALPPEVERQLKLAGNKRKVGIVWSGSVTFANNRKRAVHAREFLRFAEVPNVQLFSLQKGECESQLAECGGEALIPALGSHLQNFAQTASLLKRLDLVIMTDSAVAHLAGSVGTPVWNMLHHMPYWLYGHGSDGTPWYASMKFYRQEMAGDWDGVFKRACRDLEKLVAKKKNR